MKRAENTDYAGDISQYRNYYRAFHVVTDITCLYDFKKPKKQDVQFADSFFQL
jgi:hypothetical protein